jgi:hypothetical protein
VRVGEVEGEVGEHVRFLEQRGVAAGDRGGLGYHRRARFCGGKSPADGQRVREREGKRGRPERRLGNALT